MRKELLLAIFLGGTIGVTVAFGIWRFTTSINKTSDNNSGLQPSSGEQVEQITQGNEQQTSTEGLTIVRPRANAVTSEGTIQIAGITRPNSYVLIAAEDDHVSKVDSGTFEVEVEIAGGINSIPVYVLTQGQQMIKTTVLVTYSDEIENADAAQSIMGAITDITESSLQIRNSSGEISQVALSDSTTYASTVQTTEDISFDDLAIGDFVAAIGQMDDMDVLNANRVIVSGPLEESEDVVVFGTVQTLTNRDFLVKDEQSGEERSIDATDRPVVTALNDEGEIATARLTSVAEEGDWIIIIGDMEDDELVARRIHVL